MEDDAVRSKIIYIADDGSEWASHDAANKADEVNAAVDSAMKGIPAPPSKSSERTRIDPEAMLNAWRMLINFCSNLWPDEPVFKHDAKIIHPMSYAGRFLSECGYQSIDRAWRRFACSNESMTWMYQQPFYAIHEDEWIAAFASRQGVQ